MSSLELIKACMDFGVHKDGADLGPQSICNHINLDNYAKIYELKRPNGVKDFDINNKKKNIELINQFNEE